ncbi:hypothetical protein AL346_22155 (plasmid) [Chelatococcus sp. CO-6]|nr:hypothetical protein AL346_22155 [Chelatococcus sp. CO-6]
MLASRLLDMASTVLLTPMRMLVMPILSRNTAHRGVFTSSYDMMVRSTLAIWMPMLLALGIGAEVFVLALLGPQWSGAVGILQAMCLVAFTLPLSFFAGSALSAAGRPDLFFKLATAKLLTVSIFIVIGAQFSLTAVGFAWSGAFACIVPLCLFTLQKACGVNWTVGTKSALRIAAAGLGFAVCALVTINWMAAYDWPMLLSLLSGIGLGFVVYAVLLEYVLLPGFVRTALKEIRIFFVRAAPETERASGA